jgi:ABC-type bacteriocin/lantibiotic exporter with double-glycine peptidase domain
MPAAARDFIESGTEAVRLLCGDRRRVDVAVIRRAFTEAMLSWPGSPEQQWWKWMVECGRSMGYAVRALDAPIRDVSDLLRHGAAVATWSHSATGDCQMAVVNRSVRRKVLLHELPQSTGGRWVFQRELTRVLGDSHAGEMRRWVVLDPMADDVPLATEAMHAENHHGHAHVQPWVRLWDFLQPERSDMGIVAILAMVIGMLTLATPIAVEALVNTVSFGTLLQPLIVLSIILLTFLAFAAGLRFLEKFVVELIQRRLFARVVARLAWQLPRVRRQTSELSAELVNRFFDVVTLQKMLAQLLLDGLTVILTVGLGMIVLAFYHPWLLAFDVSLLVLLVINVFVLSRGAVRTSIEESRGKYAVAAWLETLADCPLAFKSGGVAEFALTRADRLTADYLVARQSHFRVLMRHIFSGLALEAFASAVLLGLGGFLVIQGQMTLGQLVAAELIVNLILQAVAKFDKHLEAYYDLVTSMDKLGHLFDLSVEPASGVMHVGGTGPARLSIRQLTFGHEGEPPILQGVTLDVAPGEIVAVTGPTGCGKSTLLDLIFRLKECGSGHIVLDDVDVSDLRVDVLRQHVGLARGLEVIEGNLAENVHLYRPEVSPAVVREALQRVGLVALRGSDDPVESHTDAPVQGTRSWSLQTRLTPRGGPLSENQVRRLMLARALAVRSRLLLIDGLLDAMSDNEARSLIGELRQSTDSCTFLIATSRETITEMCDRTLTL